MLKRMSVGEIEVDPRAPEPEVPDPFPSPADGELPPSDSDLSLAWLAIGAGVVAACTAIVLWQLHPFLILRDTTASGGDMGAHVWFPAYLRDHLLPHGRVAGWSPDWFGGFPAGQFYFPLPALAVVLLDVVLPYNVAFKIVTAIGPIAMPVAAYAFGRGLRIRRPGPELFAVAVTVFLFFKGIEAVAGSHDSQIQFNQRIMGGTIVNTLAGEFSYSIALAFALAFLGALAYSLRTRRRMALAAVLLAATVLSHVVVGILAIVGALVIWLFHRPIRNWRPALAIGVVAGLLTAFWSIPLLAGFPYTANMRYTRINWFVDYMFPGEFWWVFVLATVGVVFGLVRRDRGVLSIIALTATFGLVFRFWPELHAWNLRFLPFWYMGAFLLAAVGAAEIVRAIGQKIAKAWIGPAPGPSDLWVLDAEVEGRRFRVVKTVTIASLVAVLVLFGLWHSYADRGTTAMSRLDLDFWAEWNYSGYQDTSPSSTKPKAYPEYKALMDTMGKLPPGRAMWEGGNDVDNYGTPLALMLLPYWTNGRIGSFEGLYYESAASTPYDFMAIAPLAGCERVEPGARARVPLDRRLRARRAVPAHARRPLLHGPLGRDEGAAPTPSPNLRLVASVRDHDKLPPGTWKIYEVRDHALVAPLKYEPVVVDPHGGTQSECFGGKATPDEPKLGPWECTAAAWWNSPSALDRPLAADGPSEWARANGAAARTAPRRALPSVRVTDVHEGDDTISFRVSKPGVPVVVRSSYYPNWVADGAKGPWRLTPNLMVVVPTSHTVTLHYARSGAEWLGIALTVVGIAGLIGLIVWGRRRRRRGDPGDEPVEPVEESVEPVVTTVGDGPAAGPAAGLEPEWIGHSGEVPLA